ncbi:hypothetical protein ACFSKI_22745 [Pseudogracilibacillus auburnensis]|uniref:Uncharacterized protein n=1 Tax=Pseudogracilibacillus auburnensis TaxID=1494959 RepID=A0A2V3VGI2_9BACI|nr:hypothetical protein [Pseudogracilibacillus auburnensis]MBO1003281.1 hypothetical protein [Pseudogracilibacillus auburnensis]PXW80867.1 hypothetical protein DFR56_12542 [Pseudogracilibacillus auburnensis]
MKRSDMWLTLLASVGVGAAAFYTMSKSGQPMNKAMETVAPMLSGMTNNNTSGGSGNNQQSGQFGSQSMS